MVVTSRAAMPRPQAATKAEVALPVVASTEVTRASVSTDANTVAEVTSADRTRADFLNTILKVWRYPRDNHPQGLANLAK